MTQPAAPTIPPDPATAPISPQAPAPHPSARSGSLRVFLWSLALLLFGLLTTHYAARLEHRAAETRQRDAVRAELETIRSALSREIFGAIQLTEGIAGLITVEGGITDEKFRALAGELLRRSDLIRNLVVAPSNTVRHVFPLAGNERTLGFDYTTNADQWPGVERMIRERRPIIAGPVALVQGGIGIIGRTPIYLPDPAQPEAPPRYWGLTSTVIEFDRLLARTSLAAAGERLMIALRGRDGQGAGGEPFWGNYPVFDDSPVTVDVPLPSGQWQLAAIPRRGWTAFNPLTSVVALVGGALSLFLSALLFLLLREGEARTHEVRQRRHTEAALAQSERQYRELVEHANSIILRWRADGSIVFLNEYGQRFFGYTADELVGRPVLGTIVPETDSTGRDLRRMLAEIAGQPAAFEQSSNENMRRNGERVWIAWTNRAVVDHAGRLTEVLSVGTDITERKRAQDELRRREEQLRLIMENLTDLVAVLDLEGRRLYNSPSYGAILGSPERLQGTLSFDQIHPEDQARVRASFAETVRSGVGQRLEYRLVDQHGGTRHIESQGSVIRNAAGAVSQVIVVSRDVTERRRVEELVRNEREFSDTMIESMPGILYFYDDQGGFLRWNHNFEMVSGYTGAEIARMHPLEFFRPEDQPQVRERIAEVFTKGESSVEAPFLAKDGRTTPYFFTGRRVLYNGKSCLVGMGIDISERMRAELALRVLNQTLELQVAERTAALQAALVRAEAADRIKSAFLATMSHELRTPLNSIIGFTGIVLQGLAGPLNPEQTKQLGMVRGSARHLLELINDVLDISKIEAGQLEVRAEPFDLAASVERVMASVRPLAEKKGLTLNLRMAPGPKQLVSDRRRVEQILLNLLNNAIKFTDRGGATLVVEDVPAYQPTPDAPPRPAVRLRVTDTGIGIRPEDLALLFQPFRQLDTGLTRQHEGTGLGLAICRRLAGLLGGEIHATSQWQQGSEFTAIVPLQKPD